MLPVGEIGRIPSLHNRHPSRGHIKVYFIMVIMSQVFYIKSVRSYPKQNQLFGVEAVV
jgi:hypothetical protein